MRLREDVDFAASSEVRKAEIEVVTSAFAATIATKAYLTMPVTTGVRYYEVLDRHGVRTVAELEARAPGALRDEVILPNVAASLEHAGKVTGRTGLPLVVPGVFEAGKRRWSQADYMVLWLRVITAQVGEVHLCEGWEYSNGGAAEFVRATLVRHGQVGDRREPMSVLDHEGSPVSAEDGARLMSGAVRDLRSRGHDPSAVVAELGRLSGFAASLAFGTRREWAEATATAGTFDAMAVMRSGEAVGAALHFRLD